MCWIGDIVTGLVECYETDDVYELCDCLGISIVQKELNGAGSFFLRNQNNDEFIFIDNSITGTRKREIIAHELGHAILHVDLNVAYYKSSLLLGSKLEKQANIFASELLLKSICDDNCIYDGMTYRDLASCLEVSETFVKNKFKNY